MRTALFVYGFKSGFKDIPDRHLRYAAFAGAMTGIVVVFIVIMSRAGH